MKKQKSPEDQEIEQLKITIKDLICGTNMREVFTKLLPEESFKDEVSAQDMGRTYIMEVLDAIILDPNSQTIIKRVAFSGLILIYYGLSLEELDDTKIYSKLCEVAYNDQLDSFVNHFFENDLSRKQQELARLKDFSVFETTSNNALDYWFKGAVKLIARKLKHAQKKISQPQTEFGSNQVIEDWPVDKYDLYALVANRLSVMSVQNKVADQQDDRDKLRNLIKDNHIIVITGGPSMGTTSWVKNLIAKFSDLNLDDCYHAVYIDAMACKEKLLLGVNISEIIFEMHFPDQISLRKYVVSHLQQMIVTGELLVVMDNFSRLHSFNENDLIIRNSAVLFDEQKIMLDALSGVSRIVMISCPWQIEPLTTAFQEIYQKDYGDEVVCPIKIVDLTLLPECQEKFYQTHLATQYLAPNQDLREYYWHRYRIFCSDFRGIKAAVKVLQSFHDDRHLRIFQEYLLDLAKTRGFDFSEDIDLFQYPQNKELRIFFDYIGGVVRNIELGDFIDLPLYWVSVNLCFPLRDRDKGPAFMFALNYELFDLLWVKESLYVKISNDGLLAVSLSTFGIVRLGQLRKILNDKQMDTSVIDAALSCSTPDTQDTFKSWMNLRRLNYPKVESELRRCNRDFLSF
jgi:hypothetical protein